MCCLLRLLVMYHRACNRCSARVPDRPILRPRSIPPPLPIPSCPPWQVLPKWLFLCFVCVYMCVCVAGLAAHTWSTWGHYARMTLTGSIHTHTERDTHSHTRTQIDIQTHTRTYTHMHTPYHHPSTHVHTHYAHARTPWHSVVMWCDVSCVIMRVCMCECVV